MKRLVCIVEGKGDVNAVPALCGRILKYLAADASWFVDPNAIRLPRGHLVDESVPSPDRPALARGLRRCLILAAARPADAALVLVDSDDDCAACWSASARAEPIPGPPFETVMAVREFEAWFLWNRAESDLRRAGISDPESIRDAKGRLRRFVPRYKPTLHQLEEVRRLDVARVRRRSPSFEKLVRTLATLCDTESRRS